MASSEGRSRLTPAMSSRRLQVLDFVRDYIVRHSEAPSLSEIANGCGIGRTRAHALVRTLVRQGHLMRRRGVRGLMLPSAIEEAKRKLRLAGYRIDESSEGPCTNSRLLPLPALDYLEEAQQREDENDDSGDGERGE
ncbi:MAG: helix-turn-helix domain-containing protein [Burkholderiaceae bacterium]